MTTASPADFLSQLSGTEEFPLLSDVLSKINNLMDNENASTMALASLLKFDTSLSDKLLKIVNSVSFANYGGSISSLNKAVQILGFNKIRTATLNVVLLESIKSQRASDITKNTATELFLSGILAKYLLNKENADDLIISSVMSEIGKLMLMYHFPEHPIVEDHSKSSEWLSELSAQIANKWGIPAEYTEDASFEIKKSVALAKKVVAAGSLPTLRERMFAIKTILGTEASDLKLSVAHVKALLSKSIQELKARAMMTMTSVVDLKVLQSLSEVADAPSILDDIELKKMPTEAEILVSLKKGLVISKETSVSHDIKKLLVTLHQGFNADCSLFMSLDSNGKYSDKLSIGFSDASKATLKFPVSEASLFSESIKTGKIMYATDALFSKDAKNVPLWYQNANLMSSIVCIPLQHEGVDLGLVILGSKEKDALVISKSHLPTLITYIRWVLTKHKILSAR